MCCVAHAWLMRMRPRNGTFVNHQKYSCWSSFIDNKYAKKKSLLQPHYKILHNLQKLPTILHNFYRFISIEKEQNGSFRNQDANFPAFHWFCFCLFLFSLFSHFENFHDECVCVCATWSKAIAHEDGRDDQKHWNAGKLNVHTLCSLKKKKKKKKREQELGKKMLKPVIIYSIE